MVVSANATHNCGGAIGTPSFAYLFTLFLADFTIIAFLGTVLRIGKCEDLRMNVTPALGFIVALEPFVDFRTWCRVLNRTDCTVVPFDLSTQSVRR